MSRSTDPSPRQRMVMRIALLACVLAAAYFAWRGPVRLWNGANDLAMVYGSARAWLAGSNPYDAAVVDRVYLAAGGPANISPASRGSFDLLYPPTALPLMAPVAIGSWPVAMWCWEGLNLAAFAAGVWGIITIAGWRRHQARTWFFIAAALAFAPVHTNFAHGQTGLIGFGLIAAAQGLRVRGRTATAGVLLGLATALKPQLAAIFIAYELLQKRWSVASWAAAAFAIAAALGIVRLQVAGVDWLVSYRANIAEFVTNQNGNPTASNPYRYQLLNLHYPLHTVVESRAVVTAMVWALLGAAGLAFLALRRRREDPGELIALSLASVATLLLVYHRFYDAVLLLFCVALVIREAADRATATRPTIRTLGTILAAAGTVCLFLPGASVLFILQRDGRLPEWLTRSAFWDSIVMPHQVWAMLLICAALLAMLAGTSRTDDSRG